MKKEVLFAIFVGFAIGLIITFGIYQAQKSYKSQSQVQDYQPGTQTQTQATTSHSITVSSPLNESVSSNTTVTIQGSTTPLSYVSVVTNDQENFVESDSSGQFIIEIELEPGANLITITSVSQLGESASTDLIVSVIPPINQDPVTESDDE